MPAIIRIGDPVSCGDTSGEGSGNVFANGIPVTRKGPDLTVGHCYNPVPFIVGSPTVFANKIPVVRVSDSISSHKCGKSRHSGKAANGSPDVMVNDGRTGPVSVSVTVEQYIQPGVNKLFAAQVMADDPDVSPQFQEYKRVKEAEAGIVSEAPTFIEQAPATTNVPAIIPSDCNDIVAHQGKFPGDFKLSTNFTLSQLTTNTLVSNYPLKSNAGLSEKEIVCNLRALCVNILEPMVTRYGLGNVVINSGFRYDGKSQHGKGQAVDISFRDVPSEPLRWARAIDIKDNFNYDQYIYEAQRSVWFHVSYNASGNRKQTLTKPRNTNTYYAGIQRLIT
jgi:uncharacterized Zn-binding protein involved in type VI secretion